MEKIKEVWIVDLREGDHDIWQAYAVGVTYHDIYLNNK